MMRIYHNPRCRKSRETLKLITDSGVEPEIVEYLITPPSQEELTEIIGKLGISPPELLRKSEGIFKEKFKGNTFTGAEWIKIMVKHPKLIERPIVVKGDKAIIGRPPENILPLL
ncbi:MAG: arsenate reductase (glutaredoxin) [Bacteroidota bacterium]